jgi:hypothetical protein
MDVRAGETVDMELASSRYPVKGKWIIERISFKSCAEHGGGE